MCFKVNSNPYIISGRVSFNEEKKVRIRRAFQELQAVLIFTLQYARSNDSTKDSCNVSLNVLRSDTLGLVLSELDVWNNFLTLIN